MYFTERQNVVLISFALIIIIILMKSIYDKFGTTVQIISPPTSTNWKVTPNYRCILDNGATIQSSDRTSVRNPESGVEDVLEACKHRATDVYYSSPISTCINMKKDGTICDIMVGCQSPVTSKCMSSSSWDNYQLIR